MRQSTWPQAVTIDIFKFCDIQTLQALYSVDTTIRGLAIEYQKSLWALHISTFSQTEIEDYESWDTSISKLSKLFMLHRRIQIARWLTDVALENGPDNDDHATISVDDKEGDGLRENFMAGWAILYRLKDISTQVTKIRDAEASKAKKRAPSKNSHTIRLKPSKNSPLYSLERDEWAISMAQKFYMRTLSPRQKIGDLLVYLYIGSVFSNHVFDFKTGTRYLNTNSGYYDGSSWLCYFILRMGPDFFFTAWNGWKGNKKALGFLEHAWAKRTKEQALIETRCSKWFAKEKDLDVLSEVMDEIDGIQDAISRRRGVVMERKYDEVVFHLGRFLIPQEQRGFRFYDLWDLSHREKIGERLKNFFSRSRRFEK